MPILLIRRRTHTLRNANDISRYVSNRVHYNRITTMRRRVIEILATEPDGTKHTYNSVRDAAERLDRKPMHIIHMCRTGNGTKAQKGWRFTVKTEPTGSGVPKRQKEGPPSTETWVCSKCKTTQDMWYWCKIDGKWQKNRFGIVNNGGKQGGYSIYQCRTCLRESMAYIFGDKR